MVPAFRYALDDQPELSTGGGTTVGHGLGETQGEDLFDLIRVELVCRDVVAVD